MPVPATFDVTPVLEIVTVPVAPETDIPVPETFDVTPVFVRVIEPLLVSGLPDTDRPPPLVIPTLDKRLWNNDQSELLRNPSVLASD